MRPGEDQPTPFTEPAAGPALDGPASDAPSEAAADAGALDLPSSIGRRTGVVFVHGIGTQAPGETFLDWSGPIVELLTDWHADQLARDPDRADGARVTDDPVWRSEFAFSAASPPYLELTIPAHAGVAETTWVLTEAWWASDLRAPSLGRVIDYLRRRMRGLVSGIAQGYRERSPLLVDLAVRTEVIGTPPPLDWRLIERLDRVQARTFGARLVGWTIGVVGVAMLIGYDLLRRVPIAPIRDFAARRMVDSFLVDWFGDLPVLLDDPVQSANVRARVARSIERLLDDGCDAIVLVAHSGGALVSFETLLDPAYRHLRVDKLVTLGQGLGLAWRLAADPQVREIRPGHRLVGNLAEARPGLRWVDVWASYDPAPAGPLPARGGLTAADVDAAAGGADAGAGAAGRDAGAPTAGSAAASPATAGAATAVATGPASRTGWLWRSATGEVNGAAVEGEAPRIVVESRPVTNEMNVLTDHGSYWGNPEGFLVPLLRHLDAARGDAADSRFFRGRADRARRIVWRRQRVAALAAWGWTATVATILAIVVLVIRQAAGDERLRVAGDGLAALWGRVPGHEVITAPIEAVAAVVGGALTGAGLAGIAAGLASLGPPLLGLLLVVGLASALIKVGVGRWRAWDVRERRGMHPEIPRRPDRTGAGAMTMLLLGGLAALVAATLGSGVAVGVCLALGAAAAAVVGLTRPFSPDRVERPADD